MADYTKPKPTDPIGYQPEASLRIHCSCGRIVVCRLQDFAQARRLSVSMRIYEMIARLRCRSCGAQPSFAEVTKPTRGFTDNYWGTGRTERRWWSKR